MLVLSDVRVGEKSKMAACNRKWLWNNVCLSLYTWWQRNFNGYGYVFEAKQLDWAGSEYCTMSGWVMHQKMTACKREWFAITYSSTRMHLKNDVEKGSYVMINHSPENIKYSHWSNRVDGHHLWLTTHTRIKISPVMLLEPKSISIVVGISLRSCMQTEIHVISYTLPVTTYPDAESVRTSLFVFLDLKKWRFPPEVRSYLIRIVSILVTAGL